MEGQEKKELNIVDILRVCFNYIGKTIIKIGDILAWALQFSFQAKWTLLVAIGCGILFSIYWSRPGNLRYRGETEVRFNVHDAYFYKNQINLLNSYCENENKEFLSQALHITPAEASLLRAINSYFFINIPDEVDYTNKFNIKDTVNRRMSDRLMLVVIAQDKAIYSTLLGKIKNFFESNSIVSEENAIRLRHIDEKIDALDNEIQLLDSLRKKEYFRKDAETLAKLDQTILLSEKERKLYHNDILNLENNKRWLQWEKEIKPESVRFITPFKIDSAPINNLKKSLLKFIPAFFVLGFFVAWTWKQRRKIYGFLSEEE